MVNFDFLKLLTDRFQVCRGARVIRILCTSIKTLCERLVEVICLRQPTVRPGKVDSRSVLVGHLAMNLIV